MTSFAIEGADLPPLAGLWVDRQEAVGDQAARVDRPVWRHSHGHRAHRLVPGLADGVGFPGVRVDGRQLGLGAAVECVPTTAMGQEGRQIGAEYSYMSVSPAVR
ncbi:MAG TPA: hypothetical protein VD978_31330 [Azospirillum sp.]|nr:hypothetical protein [Azospirillum sp.]